MHKLCYNIIREKLLSLFSLYRSSGQSHDVFKKFADDFEIKLDKITNKNPYRIVILGDFTAKSDINMIQQLTKAQKSML